MRELSQDPEAQPNPCALPCGCVLTAYECDHGVKELEVIACRAGCKTLAAALQLADDLNVSARVEEL